MDLDKLVSFINNREQARFNKMGETKEIDPIVEKYFFTNVNKWDDRQSKMFLDRAKRGDEFMEALIFPIVHKDHYMDLPLDRQEVIEMLERGEVKRQTAYVLGSNNWGDQQKMVAEFLKTHPTFWVADVRQISGYGDFLVNQVMSNLRKLSNYTVYQDMFIAGNGTKLGYQFLTGRTYSTSRDIQELRAQLLKRTDISEYVKDSISRDINNMGNILCEYSKYCKIERMLYGGKKCRFRNYKS